MGSSSSIMQATLNSAGGRGTEVSSTITFHCQELIDSVQQADQGKNPSPARGHHGDQEPGAVTRYFPIIQQPAHSMQPVIPEQHILPNFADGGDSKQTKENYYYSCDICSKGFMFKGSLNRHLARHVQHGSGEEVASATRKLPIATRPGIGGNNEVRYQLKDPRLYEQHAKLQGRPDTVQRKGGSTRPPSQTTKPYSGPVRKGKMCSMCDTPGHSASVCKTLQRNLLIGQKVLAICSCLKCNKSFDDVDKLKEHISECQGFQSKQMLHISECNVR